MTSSSAAGVPGGLAPLRMVATDLDGTIVRRDMTVSPRTTAAFRACADAGIEVVVVTGRPPRWVVPIAETAGLTGTAVCGNGAVVWDLDAHRALHVEALSPDAVREVARRLAVAMPGRALALETTDGFRREPEYQTRWDTGLEQVVGTLEELLADAAPVVKVLVRDLGSTSDAMLATAREVLDGVAAPTHSNARDSLIEVMADGVGKASTLAEIAATRGVDAASVVAFGDMPNDLAMLQWAGRGYAMADGHPDVLAAADAVAPPCEEDGVAQVIESLLADRVVQACP